MATTRLIFYPNCNKKSKKTGKIPFYLRVLHNGIKAEARLNVEIDEKDRLLWNERTMSFEQRDNRINSRIFSMRSDFEKLEAINSYKLANLTAKEIINYLVGVNQKNEKEVPTAIDFIIKHYNNHVINNKSFAYNTVKTYRKAINHFKNFIQINKIGNITIEQFDHIQAQSFKTYLTSDSPSLLKKAMTEVSASSVICKVKAIFGNAVDSDLIRKNPFAKIRLTTQSPPKPKLTVEELSRIYHLDLAEFPSLDIYRDIFLFACFTGLSYNDIVQLRRNIISSTQNGLKITTARGKTNKSIEQLTVSYAESILNKYQDHPQVKIKSTLLPSRSMTQVNIYVKILADMCKINKKLSTSIARCTCRQLLSEAGVKEPLAVHKIMGWSTNKSIDFKYYEITETLLNDAKCTFQVYLDKYLKYGSNHSTY